MKKIIVLLAILSAFSCDYVDEPLTAVEGGVDAAKCPEPTFPPNTNTKRNILVEDFTGQKCTYCPVGAYILDTIHQNIGSQLIPVALHVGGFAEPETSGAKYREDFRTTGGTETYNQFAPGEGLPTFIVNRIDTFMSPAQYNISYYDLSNTISAVRNYPSIVNLQLITSFDPADGTVCVYSETEILQPLTDDHSIVVVLLEDSIVGYQKYIASGGGDPIYGPSTGEISNYVQKHVARKFINGYQGKKIASATDAV